MTIKTKILKASLPGGLLLHSQVYEIQYLHPEPGMSSKVEISLITPGREPHIQQYSSLRFSSPETLRIFINGMIRAYAMLMRGNNRINEYNKVAIPEIFARELRGAL